MDRETVKDTIKAVAIITFVVIDTVLLFLL